MVTFFNFLVRYCVPKVALYSSLLVPAEKIKPSDYLLSYAFCYKYQMDNLFQEHNDLLCMAVLVLSLIHISEPTRPY